MAKSGKSWEKEKMWETLKYSVFKGVPCVRYWYALHSGFVKVRFQIAFL